MKRYKLGEIGEIRMCKRILKEETNSVGGVPFFKIGTFGGQADVFITKEKFDEYKNAYSYPKKGDVLISAAGTIGRTVVFDGKDAYFQDSNIVWIENDESKVLNEYLFYCYKNIHWTTSVGSTILRLYNDDIRNTDIIVPPLSDQKKIASVLSALDDKIALNKKMNQKLEAMAKRLYDYWFVQYDFPDKNGHPYKTTGGPMTYNPTLKREIPVGWEVAPISEFIEKNFNGEWGKEEASEDDIRVHCVRGADIVDMVDMPVRYISTKKKDRILNPNDIIVEISGGSPTQSTGRATFVTRNTLNRFDSPMTCSNFCQIIRLKDAKCASYFFEMWQKFYASDIFFNFEGKTSGIKNFQTDSFIATPWAHPPKELMYKFDEMYQSFMKKKERLITENQKLTALRDKLLPLLMNGQVVVG